MKIRISADSTVDLSPELIEKHKIAIMPLLVTMGDVTKRDGVDVTTDELFSYVKETKELPKTASPSITVYQEFFDELLKDADCVIHFVVSSKMSSCYSSALKASEEYGHKVFVVDSRSLSTGIALLVLRACDMIERGVEPIIIAKECREMTKYVQASFILGNLDFMHKGGRCSGAMSLSAKFLRIKPAILVKDGEMVVGKKYMGKMEKVIENYINDILTMYPDFDRKRVFVTHTPIESNIVDIAKQQLDGVFDEIYETNAGATIASHCGAGTLGILFMATKPVK